MWLSVSGLESLLSDAKHIELRRKGMSNRTRKIALSRGFEGNEREFEDA